MFELMFGVYHRGRTVVNVKTDKIQKVLQALFSYAQDIFYKKGEGHLFSQEKQVALGEGIGSGAQDLSDAHNDQNGACQGGERQRFVEENHTGKGGADRGDGAE